MEPEEYGRTARAERDLWWFRELREVWTGLLERAGCGEGPILDAGCGTGANLAELARSPRRRPVGLDLHPLALLHARRATPAPLVRGSVEHLPFADRTFAAVVCTDVLYHAGVESDARALCEIRRVLRPGGMVVLNLPAFEALRSAHDRAVHTARRYTRGRIRELLEQAGLRPIRIVHWNGLLFLPAALYRLLGRRGRTRSDLANPPAPLHAILRAIGRADAALALAGLLPFGLSIAAVARREEG